MYERQRNTLSVSRLVEQSRYAAGYYVSVKKGEVNCGPAVRLTHLCLT